MRCIEIYFNPLVSLFSNSLLNWYMRCIEIHPLADLSGVYYLELIHEMYWNCTDSCIGCKCNSLNWYMRCIEMLQMSFGSKGQHLELIHEMYWNKLNQPATAILTLLELIHEMYWNCACNWLWHRWVILELIHEMYWNIILIEIDKNLKGLNWYMRCIEICNLFYRLYY